MCVCVYVYYMVILRDMSLVYIILTSKVSQEALNKFELIYERGRKITYASLFLQHSVSI